MCGQRWLITLCKRAGATVPLAALVILFTLTLRSQGTASSQQASAVVGPDAQSAFASDRLVVRLRRDSLVQVGEWSEGRDVVTGFASLDAILARFGVRRMHLVADPDSGDPVLKERLGLSRTYVLELAGHDIREARAAVAADPHVEWAELDYAGMGADVVPNDPGFGDQWSLRNTGQQGGRVGADIHAPAAWEITTGNPSVVIALLDTGVDLTHPDLEGQTVAGYDFVQGDDDPQDDHGHGTHVAGIAAARTDNAVGVAGVCWQCRIMPLKVLDSSSRGYYSWWASALVYAADQGVKVANISAGGTATSSILYDAVTYAYSRGMVVVAAMMNSGDATVHYPAGYGETIAVGASGRKDERASFSSFGSHIDLTAPGVGIYSAIWPSRYSTWSGTSMAAPHVSGLVGLLLTVRPDLTPGQVASVLAARADDQVGTPGEDAPGWDPYHGAGRVNAERALRTLVGEMTPTVTPSRTPTVTATPSATPSVGWPQRRHLPIILQ